MGIAACCHRAALCAVQHQAMQRNWQHVGDPFRLHPLSSALSHLGQKGGLALQAGAAAGWSC